MVWAVLALITGATLGPAFNTALIWAGFFFPVHCGFLWCIGRVIAVASPLTTSTELKIQQGFSLIYQAHRSVFFLPTHCSETALPVPLSLLVPLVFNEYLGERDVRMTWRVCFRKHSEVNEEEHFQAREPKLFCSWFISFSGAGSDWRISRTLDGIKGIISRDGNLWCKRGRRGERAVGVFEKKSWTLSSNPCQSVAIMMKYLDTEMKLIEKNEQKFLWGP